ncbi:hypothetical protein KI387_038767, partial [Taxus chinensis]
YLVMPVHRRSLASATTMLLGVECRCVSFETSCAWSLTGYIYVMPVGVVLSFFDLCLVAMLNSEWLKHIFSLAGGAGVLPPLSLGAARCVLVGDPQQRPATVLSQVAGTLQKVEAFLSTSNRQAVQLCCFLFSIDCILKFRILLQDILSKLTL